MPEQWLIAVDLDGTLFNADRLISTRTLNTLQRVTDIGHKIVILTGRSRHSSLPRLQSIPAGTRLFCSNGAYEYDPEKQEVVWASTLTASKSMEIRQRILYEQPTASFGWESANGLCYEQRFMDEAGGAHTLEQAGQNESMGQSALFKMFVRTPEKKGADLADTLQALFGTEIEVSSSGVPFVEITATGTNKGAALAKLALELGFESERTIAFGDNQNDLSMLQWAGESVAMGNAIARVHSIATASTQTNTEDGVAQFLEARFLD